MITDQVEVDRFVPIYRDLQAGYGFVLAIDPNGLYSSDMGIEPAISPGILILDGMIKDAMSGKLTAINMFTQINAVAFPFQSLPFFVTALVSNLTGPIEGLTFQVSIINADTSSPVMNLQTP